MAREVAKVIFMTDWLEPDAWSIDLLSRKNPIRAIGILNAR